MFVHEGLFKEFVMVVREFYELECACGGGVIGVCVWFGAPIMHWMYGLSFA